MNLRGPGVMLLRYGLLVAGLVLASANGQTLKRRGGIVTPQLRRAYDSPEYDGAYEAAEATYNATTPKTFTPYLWDPKRPLLWIGYKQSEFGRYTLDFGDFEDQLDAASEDPLVRSNPQKVAQLSQIQDRLTEDNLIALNTMVTVVDLGTLFVGNNKPEIADLWVPWQLPGEKRLLNESKMRDVLKFVSTIIRCFADSRTYQVRYASSSSFSSNVPRGSDNKPLSFEEAASYWRWNNHRPVDTAIVSLYNSLHQAQQTAAKERLLDIAPKTVRPRK